MFLRIHTYVGYMHAWGKERKREEREGNVCMCLYVCVHTSHFLTQVYREDKIKIILQQQAGSQRFIYIHCYHQGDEWGRSEALFTRSTMGVKEEERCHTDMHKLEGRGIWKVLLRKPWWHNTREKKGKEACLYFRWLLKKKSVKGFRKRLVLTLSALLWILKGVLLAPGAEPGAGAGNKREIKNKVIQWEY